MSCPRSLRRFWFPSPGHLGIGVTAFSQWEASELARGVAENLGWPLSGEVVADVDIRELDQEHVIPNMGPPSYHGVWYPRQA
jgi:hypothetical protein